MTINYDGILSNILLKSHLISPSNSVNYTLAFFLLCVIITVTSKRLSLPII